MVFPHPTALATVTLTVRNAQSCDNTQPGVSWSTLCAWQSTALTYFGVLRFFEKTFAHIGHNLTVDSVDHLGGMNIRPGVLFDIWRIRRTMQASETTNQNRKERGEYLELLYMPGD